MSSSLDLEQRLAVAESRIAELVEALGTQSELHNATTNISIQLAQNVAKIAIEVGVLSKAVSYLGMMAAFTAPPGVIEDGVKFALDGLRESDLDQGARTVENLRLMWRAPPKR